MMGQTHHEFASTAQSVAQGFDRPIVQFHDTADQGEPDSQAAAFGTLEAHDLFYIIISAKAHIYVLHWFLCRRNSCPLPLTSPEPLKKISSSG